MLNDHNTKAHLRQLAREKALYCYSRALDMGDFDTVSAVLAQAQTDAVLEQMISEVNQCYTAEVPGTRLRPVEAVITPLPSFLELLEEPPYSLASSLHLITRQSDDLSLRTSARSGLTGSIPEGDSMKFATQQKPGSKKSKAGEVAELPTLTSHDYSYNEPPTKKRYWPLAMVASLALVMSLVVLLLLTQDKNGPAKEQKPAAAVNVPQVGAQVSEVRNTSDAADLGLSYPGAVKVDVKEADVFPNGRPFMWLHETLGAFATTDEYQKVGDYYTQKLAAAGYTIYPHPANCSASAACGQATDLVAQSDKASIELSIYAAPAWNDMHNGNGVNPFISANFLKELQPGQTLIFYTYEPLNTNQDAVPVPTITPVPVVPVAANTSVFLGPDNIFHPDNGTALVSAEASNKVGTSAGSDTGFQLDWLVSDPTGSHAQMTIEYTDRVLDRGVAGMDTIGILTDQQGRTYELTNNDGNGYDGTVNGKHVEHFILAGPSLPADVTKVTFKAGNSLSYALTGVLTMNLKSAAGQPQAVALSQAVADVNGIKVKVPYAYFGADRTVLDVVIDGSQFSKSAGANNETSFTPITAASLTIVDDKGETLGASGQAGDEVYNRDTDLPGTESIVVFKPVAAGTKNLTVKLNGIAVNQFDTSAKNAGAAPAGSGDVRPVAAAPQSQTVAGLWQLVVPVSK